MNGQPTTTTARVIFAVVLLLIAVTIWGVLVYNNPSTVEPSTTPVSTSIPQPTFITPSPTQTDTMPEVTIRVTSTPGQPSPTSMATNPTPTPQVFSFVMRGSEYQFDPALMRVPAGSQVRIEFHNTGGMEHDFVLEGTDVSSAEISPGDSGEIVFTAPSAPGEYTYYCSVGSHRAQGMEGVLEVVPPTQ